MSLGISVSNSFHLRLSHIQQKMTRIRTRLQNKIPRPYFPNFLPSNLLAYTVKRLYSSHPLYPLAYSPLQEERDNLWHRPENQDIVVRSLETIAKEGVMRHLPLDSLLKRIARSLGPQEQHQFLQLIQKESFLKNLPEMSQKAFAYFTLAETEAIVRANIPHIKSLDQLITDLSLFSSSATYQEKLSFKTKAHGLIVNFIPNLIDLFVKAFSLFDMGRIEGIWEISYMISILCKLIFIPWAVISFLEPLLLEAWLVYTITGVMCLAAISAIYTYLRWFRPTPHRVHHHFANLNEEAADSQPIIGRDKEVNWLSARMSAALNGGGRSVLIIGESGVGKTSIVNEFFRRVVKKEVLEKNLLGLQGFGISAASLEGNANYEGFSAILKSVINRIRGFEKKIAFCFTEIHAIKKNNCFLRDYLLDFLDKGKIFAICVTSKEEFNKHLSKDPEFLRRFEIYEVKPTTKKVTKQILKFTAKAMANEFEFEEKALDMIYASAEETNPKNQPSRSIDILESIINDMRQMNVHLDCVNRLEEKKTLLREKKDRFDRHYAGIVESRRAQVKRIVITQLENEIHNDTRTVEKKQTLIKLLTSMISKQKELRLESQKISSQILHGVGRRRISSIDSLKKRVIQIEAYQIPQLKSSIRTISQELAGETKVKLDVEAVSAFVNREIVITRGDAPISELPKGKTLRLEFDVPTQVGWRTDQGQRFHRQVTSEKRVYKGKYYMTLPTDKMPAGTKISLYKLDQVSNVYVDRKNITVV